jgi:resuscitation-promoting factor RpfB
VLTAVIGASVAYAAANKSITINVDGTSTKVHAFSSDVADLLASQGIKVGDRDSVAPALNASVGDGDTVVVRYARPLTLTIDGKQQTYWTTATSVDQALQALGVRTDGAALSASRSQPLGRQGLSMWLSTPKDVVLNVDGHNHPITTTAPTVGALLATQGGSMDSNDKLSRSAGTALTDGLTIKLVRIDKKRITANETIAFTTVTKKSSKLYVGDTKVITRGSSGKRTVVYDVTLSDGKVTKKKAVTTTVLRQPVAQVEEVGTKKKKAVVSSGGGGSVGGDVANLNWSALAKCESGGNPSTNTGNGYYGLYQFSSATWHSVGGSGLPSNNSSAEQTYRAQILYKKAGVGSWPSCGHHLYD